MSPAGNIVGSLYHKL